MAQGDWLRLLEGLDLDRLSAEQAIQEIQRIADSTLRNMHSSYYIERLEAISTLAGIVAKRPGWLGAGHGLENR